MNDQMPHNSFSNSSFSNSKSRIFIAVASLLAIIVVSVAGIAIAQRQQLLKGNVAPTAPESQPSAAEPNLTECDLVFTVE